MLVTAFIEGYAVDFGLLIAGEMFFRAHKTRTALPFPCLITELCKRANVPLTSGIDNEVPASHTQDIERMKDESRFELRTNRSPAQQTQSAPVPELSEFPAGMPMPLTVYAPPTTSSGSTSVPRGGTPDAVPTPPLPLDYRLNSENFVKTVKTVKKVEKQIAI